MKKIIYIIMFVVMAYLAFGADPKWVNDPNDCPATDAGNFSGQDCSPDQICGESGSDIAQCFDMSTLSAPSSSTLSTTDQDDGSFDGGYILNCFVASDSASPFCDNDGDFFCDRNSTCQTTQQRQTNCTASVFGKSTCGICRSGFFNCFGNINCESTSTSDCDGSANNHYTTSTCDDQAAGGTCVCDTNFYACDGSETDADGCEINTAATCNTGGTYADDECIGSSGNCTATGNNRDCDDSDSDADQLTCGTSGNGCEIELTVTANNSNSIYQTCSTFSCTATFNDCNGAGSGADADGCEIEDGTSCTVGALSGLYSGCSGSIGNCVVDKTNHTTGQLAEYSSAFPNLWTKQHGSGPVVEFNSSSNTTFHIDTNGMVGINTTSPSHILTVIGTINATTYIGDGSLLTGLITQTPVWNSSGSNVYLNDSSSNVGIGTTSPGMKLVVVGNINVSQNLTVNNTVLFVDGTSGRIGINTITPTTALHVIGDVNISGKLDVGTLNISGVTFSQGDVDIDNDLRVAGGANITGDFSVNENFNVTASSGNVNIGGTLDIGANAFTVNAVEIVGSDGEVNEVAIESTLTRDTELDNGTIIRTGNLSQIFLERNSSLWNNSGTDVVLNDINANVGIGKTTPNFKLDVAGTINASGLLLTNGTFSVSEGGSIGVGIVDPDTALHVIGNVTINDSTSDGAILIDSTNDAILFTGENGSLYQPVYGTDDDLVLYLPFSENAINVSNTTYDRSPFGNDGTLVNMNDGNNLSGWTSGKYGNALLFNGTSDSVVDDADAYVDIPNIALDGEFTMSVWFKTGASAQIATIWGEDSGVGGGGPKIGMASGNFFTRIEASTTDTSVPVPTDGEWHFYTLTRDASNKADFYIDGNANRLFSDAAQTGTYTLDKIGCNGDGADQCYNGTLDEVTVYTRALAPEEVRTHYLRGKGFGASGAITADKFRVVNTSGSRTLELNQTSFEIFDNSGADTFVVDRVNGRVGIGTTSPNDALEVVGNVRVSGSLNATNLNTTGQTILASSSGNVGIGKTSPNYKLDVDGTINASGLLLTNGSFSISQGGSIGVGIANPQHELHVIGSANVSDKLYTNVTYSLNAHPSYNPLDDELVLYLPFSEDSSDTSTQYDRSKFGSDGTLISGTVCNATLGTYGGGCSFDSSNDYISLSNLGITGSTPRTVEFWMNPLTDSSAQGIVGWGAVGARQAFIIYTDNGNTNNVYVAFDTRDVHTSSGNVFNDNEWTYVAVTYDGNAIGTDSVLIYVNGVAQTTTLAGGDAGPALTADNNYAIGRDSVSSASYFNGSLDEVKIYTRVLSSDEVRTQYLVGLNGTVKPYVDTSGNVGIGTTSPNDALEVVGNVRVSGSLNASSINATRLNINNTLFVNDSKVGIGTSAPTQALHIEGNIFASGAVDLGGKSSATPTNRLTIFSGGEEKLKLLNTGALQLGKIPDMVNSTYQLTDYALDVRGTSNFGGALALGNISAYLSYLSSDGTVSSDQKISDTNGTFTATLDDLDNFGVSVTSIGDLDGDGVGDIAVGAQNDDDGSSTDQGAVYILFMKTNGTVSTFQKISDTAGGFTATLGGTDNFGVSVTSIGDLDGDGVGDIAVGTNKDDDGSGDAGAVYILFMNTDGTVSSHQKISNTAGGFTATLALDDNFGSSVTSIGDLDGDGVGDIAVGAIGDNDGGGLGGQGAVYILFMNTDGTVSSHQKISDTAGGFTATLDDTDNFGSSVTSIGDLDGDGVSDLAVGAQNDDDEDVNAGAVYILFMNTDGTVSSHQKISDTAGGFTATLGVADLFGQSVTSIGDLDGDGVSDLAVGAPQDGDGGDNRGATYILFMNTDGTVSTHQKISDTAGSFTATLDDIDNFGQSVTSIGDLNGDGIWDIAVGANGDDDGNPTGNRGAVYILFMKDTSRIRLATQNTERLTITKAGNVGIGTVNPLSTLHVNGSGSNPSLGFRVSNETNTTFFVNASSGKVGIGTATPNATLTIAEGGTTIADEWTVRSDRSKKENIKEFNQNVLDDELKIYTYNFKNSATKRLGLMLDEVPDYLKGADGQGIDTYKLAVYTLKQTQELKLSVPPKVAVKPPAVSEIFWKVETVPLVFMKRI